MIGFNKEIDYLFVKFSDSGQILIFILRDHRLSQRRSFSEMNEGGVLLRSQKKE